MSLTFKELREKTEKESEVKKFKVGKNQIRVTKTGKGKFAVYIGKDKLDDNFASQKDAEKSARDFIKLMGEESQA